MKRSISKNHLYYLLQTCRIGYLLPVSTITRMLIAGEWSCDMCSLAC